MASWVNQLGKSLSSWYTIYARKRSSSLTRPSLLRVFLLLLCTYDSPWEKGHRKLPQARTPLGGFLLSTPILADLTAVRYTVVIQVKYKRMSTNFDENFYADLEREQYEENKAMQEAYEVESHYYPSEGLPY